MLGTGKPLMRVTIPLVAALVATACNGPGGGSLDSFELTHPATTQEGQAFDLTIEARGSDGTTPFTDFAGTVELSVSSGTITPGSVELTAGAATVNATVSDASGDVTITATGGGASGASSLTVGVTQLSGDATDPATEAIPAVAFAPEADDYSDGHPDLGDALVSHNTLLVAFTLNATVAEANAALAEVDAVIAGGVPGVAGEAAGILAIRVDTESHADLGDARATLEAEPAVDVVVEDVLLPEPAPDDTEAVRTQRVPRSNGGVPAGWTWEATPSGGNWGLERIRMPQAWNLVDTIEKSGVTVPTGVLDTGFASSHEDLAYESIASATARDHGTHVAGTVAAGFDDGTGVDGVTPFAELHARALGAIPRGGNWFRSAGQVMITSFGQLLQDEPDLRVVNISLGYNWAGNAGIDADTNTTAQRIADRHGALFGLAELIRVALGGDLPVVVAAAGNDSNHPALPPGAGTQDARYASPFANAALEHGVANIIVVESVADAPGSPGGATRSGFSNVNGHLSAPGSGVLSTVRSDGYDTKSGTSMAAPHVTGLVSYLYALQPDLPGPTMGSNAILEILQDSAVPVAGGANDRVDAFAAALEVDAYRGLPDVLDRMLDIDDGTLDGNLRVTFGGGSAFTSTDADGDGGIGDGAVDMADFRRWRDLLLQVEGDADLDLDGSADHPKKDVNGDGVVESPADENVHPLGDFNGDGRLHRSATAMVPGQFDGAMSDLGVLQTRFDDDDYAAGDLAGLIDSGDVHVRATTCLEEVAGAASVRTSVRVSGDPVAVGTRVHTAGDPDGVYTLPAGTAYDVRALAQDSSGQTIATALDTVTPGLGSDVHVEPTCDDEPIGSAPAVEITDPAEDSGPNDDEYAYDGFDDDRGQWYKDVSLAGEANDAEDGDLSGDALVWTTDGTAYQDAHLGTGESLSNVRLYGDDDACSSETHVITLTATDSDGNVSTATRSITIWTLC